MPVPTITDPAPPDLPRPEAMSPAAPNSDPNSDPDLEAVWSDEDGSLVTEYGLLAVVAATIAGVIIAWASNGALVSLFNALLRHARSLVGA